MTDITLAVCPQRGPGHVLLSSDDCQDLAATSQWRVRRVGVSASYLGSAGWQISPHSHTFEKTGAGQFLLGPNIVQHMQPTTNYIFTIIRPGVEDIDLVVAWRGIPSYRPGTDRVIFRSVSQAAAPAPSVSPSGTLDLPGGASWFDMPKTSPPPPVPPARTPDPIVQPPSPPPAPICSPMQIVAPTPGANPAPIERRLIICPNENCRRQIVNTFTQCPWCTTKLVTLR